MNEFRRLKNMSKNALIIKKTLKDNLRKFNKSIFKCNYYNKSDYK